MGKVRDNLLWGRKSIIMFQGSQAAPIRPSDKGSVEMKKLGGSEVVALDRAAGL
jgi:hypothetical protein